MSKTNSKLKTQKSKVWDSSARGPIRIWDFQAKPGYTLIEMLISVTIFSGLLIIVLGAVATSSSSSAKVSILREKSQAARFLIDQISNDIRYIDTSIELKVDGNSYNGYMVTADRLVMALHLPNTDKNSELVRKEYQIKLIANDRMTVMLTEWRHCRLDLGQLLDNCDQKSEPTDILSSVFILNKDANVFPSEFGGITVEAAENENPPISPFLSIVFTIKPVEFKKLSCLNIDNGICYKVSTTLNVRKL
mgnify:FL=1